MRPIRVLGLALLLLALTTSCTAGRVQVVTSINVLEDLVRQVGGEEVKVRSLVTGLETPHTFEVRPSHMRALAEADLVVILGQGLEPWVEDIIAGLGKEVPILEVGQDLKVLEEDNPHLWLSLSNALVMVRAISQALQALCPSRADYFAANEQSYSKKLQDLQTDLKMKVAELTDNRVVSYPASYPYLLQEMGFVEAARGELHHGQEPSAKGIVGLVNFMRREQIKVIIAEKQFSDRLPRLIAAEAGAQVAYLTPLLGGLPGSDDYLGMMKTNVESLLEALKQPW